MNSQESVSRIWVTAVVAACMWALLVWEHTHGAVASHHVLHRADLPAISNWWGGLLLPVMTWFLLGRIQRRDDRSAGAGVGSSRYSRGTVAGFAGALTYGVLMSAAFALGYPALTSWMFQGAFLLALILPLYRAEYVLGFVLGMTFVFGAVLPTLAAAFIAAVAAVLYGFVRPTAMRLAYRFVSPRVTTAR